MRYLAGRRRRHVAVTPVSGGCFDQLQLTNIAGYRGLRHVKAFLPQVGQQVLLPVNRVLFDQVKNCL